MPVLTFAEDFITIDDAEAIGTWSGWGVNAAKWDDEGDIFREGTQSVGVQPSSTGDGGQGVALVASFNATTQLITIWVYTAPGFVNTSANKGVYVRLGSDNGGDWTVDYYDYLVGGSDVAWVGKGWHLVVLDPNRTAGRTSNGSPDLTTIYNVGVGFNYFATASKSTVLAIDIMQRGTYLEVTGPWSSDPGGNGLDFNENGASADTITRDDAGSFVTDGWEIGDICVVTGTTTSNGEYEVFGVAAATLTLSIGDFTADELNVTAARLDAVIGFQDVIDKDEADDTWFGMVTKSTNAEFEINGPLYIGDQSGSDRVYFRTRSEKVVIADQPNETSGKVVVIEDTGYTAFNAGDSSGTGETRVGFGGTVFSQDDTFNGCTGEFDFSDTVSLCDVFGSLFLNIVGGVAFAADTDHHITNCTFDLCGQIDLGSVEARNLTFSGYDLTADAALLWNASIDVRKSRFLANKNTAADAAAIEHPTAGAFTYYDLTFSGNDYDINFSAASGNLTITKSGTSNPSTYKKAGAGTVTFVGSVPVTITILDAAGDPVATAQTAVYLVSDDSQVMNEDTNGLGVAEETFTGTTPADVYIRVRKASVGATKYVSYSGVGTIETGTGMSATITLRQEPIS